jgi:4a-hydroxytetrahydrobiopterin dehydratase
MMPLTLAEKSCTPCRGGVPPLTWEEAAEYHKQAPEWEVLNNATRIERTYRCKTFRDAFAFVERVAALAEAEGHHPDIRFGWGFATVSLFTKKIKGLHENDFIMAAKLDRIAAGMTQAGSA